MSFGPTGQRPKSSNAISSIQIALKNNVMNSAGKGNAVSKLNQPPSILKKNFATNENMGGYQTNDSSYKPSFIDGKSHDRTKSPMIDQTITSMGTMPT